MPKKSRKSKERRIMRDNSKPLARGEVRQVSSMTSSPKQVSVTQPSETVAEPPGYNRYVLKEIQRSLSIWAIVFALLIIIYFMLR